MKQIPLTAKIRTKDQMGTAKSARLRRDGWVPAEVYGHAAENLSVSLPTKEFSKLLGSLKGENAIFALKVEGGPSEAVLALVKEVQYGRMDHTVQHVDFLKLNMAEKIRVRVPLHVLNGEASPGFKEGGTVQQFLRSIEVHCLPAQVPEVLDFDASGLIIGDSVHVSNLKAPEGVKFVTDPQTVVIMVSAPIAEEKVAAPTDAAAAPGAAGAAAPAAGTEPEVLTAKKKDGEAAPAADGKKGAAPAADKGAKK